MSSPDKISAEEQARVDRVMSLVRRGVKFMPGVIPLRPVPGQGVNPDLTDA